GREDTAAPAARPASTFRLSVLCVMVASSWVFGSIVMAAVLVGDRRRRRGPLYEVRRHVRRAVDLARRARADEPLAGLDDVPTDHHRMVLVNHVVAVHDVLPEEVPEPDVDLDLVARQKGRHV